MQEAEGEEVAPRTVAEGLLDASREIMSVALLDSKEEGDKAGELRLLSEVEGTGDNGAIPDGESD